MVPPIDSELPIDTFHCGVCRDLLLDPVTIPCCGKTFCRDCLHSCFKKCASFAVFVPRCPAGCDAKLPCRLPASSRILQTAIEVLFPEELAQRKQELEETNENMPPGGFSVGQEVVAAVKTMMIGERLVVDYGTSGVVVAGNVVPGRISVKFDSIVHAIDENKCFHVQAFEIVPQLPHCTGVRIGQTVAATTILVIGDTQVVALGMQGTVLHQTQGETSLRITVKFNERIDGSDHALNVMPTEITPYRMLIGDFWPGQRVHAARDLMATTLLVVKGTGGYVVRAHGDMRISVQFDARVDGNENGVNVVPEDIVGVE